MVDTVPDGEVSNFYLTTSDEDETLVLELIRSDSTGIYIRNHGEWTAIDPDADNERVWDRTIITVTEEAATVFDEVELTGDHITIEAFDGLEIPDEELV